MPNPSNTYHINGIVMRCHQCHYHTNAKHLGLENSLQLIKCLLFIKPMLIVTEASDPYISPLWISHYHDVIYSVAPCVAQHDVRHTDIVLTLEAVHKRGSLLSISGTCDIFALGIWVLKS